MDTRDSIMKEELHLEMFELSEKSRMKTFFIPDLSIYRRNRIKSVINMGPALAPYHGGFSSRAQGSPYSMRTRSLSMFNHLRKDVKGFYKARLETF